MKLEIGRIYTVKTDNGSIFLHSGSNDVVAYIGYNRTAFYRNGGGFHTIDNYQEYRDATPEEAEWLRHCIVINRFISYKDHINMKNSSIQKLSNMVELKITKEKVLEAASKCSQAKETLKTLFPEVFQEPDFITGFDEGNGHFNTQNLKIDGIGGGVIAVRTDGDYKRKAFYLSNIFNWSIVVDNKNMQVLVPTKRY